MIFTELIMKKKVKKHFYRFFRNGKANALKYDEENWEMLKVVLIIIFAFLVIKFLFY